MDTFEGLWTESAECEFFLIRTGITMGRRQKKPTVFIGSSVQGLKYARTIQLLLDYDYDVTVWDEGVFALTQGTLEALISALGEFDFAILVLTPDDDIVRQGKSESVARDNVLFELGLFMGHLGRERTFIVHPRDHNLHLPTDLAGIKTATYRSQQNVKASLGAPCAELEDAMQQKGYRPPVPVVTRRSMFDEKACQDVMSTRIQSSSQVRSLHVLSAGMGSRLHFVTGVPDPKKGKIAVEVLAQSPKHALDAPDARRMETYTEYLEKYHREKLLEIRLFEAPATIRAMVLCCARRRPVFGIASWYRYEHVSGSPNTFHVIGRSNPAIILDAEHSDDDRRVLDFLIEVFDSMWEECKHNVFFHGNPTRRGSETIGKKPSSTRKKTPSRRKK